MFEKGKLYLRKQLHDKYGGNRQGGISKSAKFKIIMLFTSERGQKFGYVDSWKNGMFYYCGEGQKGDMKFVRGNKAIRDHQIDGYSLHLFKDVPGKKGWVEYIGQFVFVGYDIKEGIDCDGNRRKIIVFKLMPYEKYKEYDNHFENRDKNTPQNTPHETPKELIGMSFEEIRDLAYERVREKPKKKQTRTYYFERDKLIKEYALRRANGYCEYCGSKAPFVTKDLRPYLEVHHIYRLSDGGPDDPKCVIALCPNCHRRAHYGRDANRMKEKMAKIVIEKEKEIGLI